MLGFDSHPRSRSIVVLLVLVAVLVLGLVWQAIETADSNRETATRVLQDYARLAADEFTRRAMIEVGYTGYFTHISALRRQLEAGIDILSPESMRGSQEEETSRAARLERLRFVVDGPVVGGRFSSPVTDDVKDYIAGRAIDLATAPLDQAPFVIEHRQFDDDLRTFVFATAEGRLFGFEVDRIVLGERLHHVFQGEPLLPESLARGAINNESLYLEFSDASGKVIFSTEGSYDPYLLTIKVIDAEYSGIFLSHTVAVAIDASAADALVIGGLPRSRLPLLLVTVLLTIALLVAAILQLRREYALMSMRNNFVSEVSHELRTPLAQIRMFVETLLLERFETATDRRRALEVIDRESQRLIHLIENVLQFSGNAETTPSLNVTSGSPATLVTRIVDEFRPMADAAGNTIELELDGEARAAFDDDALRRILLNLLENAVKYGPQGQQVVVTLQATPGGARLSVRDQGPGVPAAHRDRIFEGYYRLQRERDSATAGTGIGLAVVSDLVNRLDGNVWVDSDDTGATFTVELPGAPVPS